MRQSHSSKGMQGFTLIELMIAVVVVGILTAIALPSYRGYVLRGNRAVAKTALVDIAARQENWMADRKAYSSKLGDLNFPANLPYLKTDGSTTATATASGVIYKLAMTNGSCTASPSDSDSAGGTGYVIVAVPQGTQSRDTECGTMCLSHIGAKTSTGGGANCWTR